MTPKEKSIELHAQFMKPVDGLHKYTMCFDTAKQCALICIDEIQKLLSEFNPEDMKVKWQKLYYTDVKKGIEKL